MGHTGNATIIQMRKAAVGIDNWEGFLEERDLENKLRVTEVDGTFEIILSTFLHF